MLKVQARATVSPEETEWAGMCFPPLMVVGRVHLLWVTGLKVLAEATLRPGPCSSLCEH